MHSKWDSCFSLKTFMLWNYMYSMQCTLFIVTCYPLITPQILPPLTAPCHWRHFMRDMSSFLPKNFILIVQSNYIINLCLCGSRCRFFKLLFPLFCCKFNDSKTELLLQSNYYIPRKWVLFNRFSALYMWSSQPFIFSLSKGNNSWKIIMQSYPINTDTDRAIECVRPYL